METKTSSIKRALGLALLAILPAASSMAASHVKPPRSHFMACYQKAAQACRLETTLTPIGSKSSKAIYVFNATEMYQCELANDFKKGFVNISAVAGQGANVYVNSMGESAFVLPGHQPSRNSLSEFYTKYKETSPNSAKCKTMEEEETYKKVLTPKLLELKECIQNLYEASRSDKSKEESPLESCRATGIFADIFGAPASTRTLPASAAH